MHADVSCVTGVAPYSRRLSVLHVHQPGSGGVAASVRAAVEDERRGGWTVHVAGPGAGGQPGGHEWSCTRGPSTDVVRAARTLRRVVAATRPDVVVLHSAKAGLVGRLVLRGRVPTVYLPHGWSWLALPPGARWGALLWERVAARWTSVVVAVSAGEAELGGRAGVAAATFVVDNPGPGDREPVDEELARRTRDVLDALGDGDGPVVVSVGRLARQKGQDLLLRAWPLVLRAVPSARLVLVGDGPMRQRLGRAAGPAVALVGDEPDPRAWVHRADVVVLPSRWEGCSLAMLEAMAAGRSVVVTDVAGADVVDRARAGAVVPVGDPAALAEHLVERLRDPRLAEQEGLRGAEHVRAHRGQDVALQRLAGVLSRAHVFSRSCGAGVRP